LQSIFIEAGWPIWPLLILSIVGLAIIVERVLALRTRLIIPSALALDIERQQRAGLIDANALTNLASHSPLGEIFAAMISKKGRPEAAIRLAAEEAAGDVAYKLNRFLPTLAMIATIAPLMGLFGTVVGMIEIFAAFQPDSTDPGALARGISVALYNTGFGILIAIPAVIAHRAFRSRVEHLLFEMEKSARLLLKQLAP
jgi:biopolymer transport protein ExbB